MLALPGGAARAEGQPEPARPRASSWRPLDRGPRSGGHGAGPGRARSATATRSWSARIPAGSAPCSTTAARRSRRPGPSTPVEILGLSGVPAAGDVLVVGLRRAQGAADRRPCAPSRDEAKGKRATRITLEDLHKQIADRRGQGAAT